MRREAAVAISLASLIKYRLRRRHSNNTTPAATLTLSDATPPGGIGMRTRKSQRLAVCSCRPWPSAPRTNAVGEAYSI